MFGAKFTHITFAVKNVEESVSFYEEWFGLTLHLDRRPGGSTVWMTTAGEENSETPKFVFVFHEGEVTKINHFGFQIFDRKSLDEVAKKAELEGRLVKGPIDSGGAVGSYILIKDPSGHIWEFTVGQPLEGI